MTDGTTPASVEAQTTREWTAMLRGVDGKWRPVGTVGDHQHAISTAAEWIKELDDARKAVSVACREVSAWAVVGYDE